MNEEISKLNEDLDKLLNKIEMIAEKCKTTKLDTKEIEEFVRCVKESRILSEERNAKQLKLDNETNRK